MAYDIQRWNHATKEYEFYPVPEHWQIAGYSLDMDLLVDCAGCGEQMKFGDGYTSQELHTTIGLGWSVCENCHKQETNRRKGVQYA